MIDARARVSGRLGYAINEEPAGTLHVAIARSSVPHAWLRTLDVAEAARQPGVVTVLTGAPTCRWLYPSAVRARLS